MVPSRPDELDLIVGMGGPKASITSPNKKPTPTSTVTYPTITHTCIDVSFFLKYVHVNLKDKTGILNFYDNIYVQSRRCNIFLHVKEDIYPVNGIIPDSIANASTIATGVALQSELSRPGTSS